MPHYNPGNRGYDAYPSITADGKWLYFESDRGPDWNGNNFHDIYVSRLLIDENGNPVSVKEEPVIFPFGFELHQNFPNPFNPETRIGFHLDNEKRVSLRIYDVNGRLIKTLVDGFYQTGDHEMTWNGRDSRGVAMASGVYFLELVAGNERQMRKMIVVH